MWSHLERGSSPVDWCESNYSISPLIAEFVNTVSNIVFFLFPPVLIHLSQDYAQFVNPGINVLWVLFMVVGFSSAYFHATLSLVGQLLDELAILWVFAMAYALFLPKHYIPTFIGSRQALYYGIGLFSILSSGLLILHPSINAFFLMSILIPSFTYFYYELKRVRDIRVYRLLLRCMAMTFLAVFIWIIDRMYCETWLSINFPYLHGVWHVFSFIASYTTLVVAAYLYASYEYSEQKPQLRYWPKNEFELGIPYIVFKYHCKKVDLDI